MTPKQFRTAHGDPTAWTAADFDSYEVIADTTLKHRLALRLRRAGRNIKARLTRHTVRLAA